MNNETIRLKLISAATTYDRKQSKKKFYNPYALGIYFETIDEIMKDIENGFSVRQALIRRLCDRFLSHMLKSMGEKDFTREEIINS